MTSSILASPGPSVHRVEGLCPGIDPAYHEPVCRKKAKELAEVQCDAADVLAS